MTLGVLFMRFPDRFYLLRNALFVSGAIGLVFFAAFPVAPPRLGGLDLVDTLAEEPTLRSYHLLPSVRADLLMKLGRYDEARVEFERAAELTGNARERDLSLERAARAADDRFLQRGLDLFREGRLAEPHVGEGRARPPGVARQQVERG